MAKGAVHEAWRKENQQRLNLHMNKKTDADIIAHLEQQDSKQGYIKCLIRQDIEAQRKG